VGFFVSLAHCKLGARLAQVGLGGNKKNAQNVRTVRKDGLALLPVWVKNSQ